jgi:hypothetical protein
MKRPCVNVEDTFDEIVREYGTAAVLRDVLGKSVAFPNADYVFHSEKIVAELKCLSQDNAEDQDKQAKLKAILDANYGAGAIQNGTLTDETWKKLPLNAQRDITEIFSSSIRARVKKANVQIRETKKQLKLDSYSGLLIIVNDGLLSMPPAAFIGVTERHIRNNAHSISHFIYATANVITVVKDTPVLLWFPLPTREPQTISYQFCTDLFGLWRSKVNKVLGTEPYLHEIQGDDLKHLWESRHVKNP